MLKVPANLVDQKGMIVDSVSRIGNMNDLRQRSLRPWVPPS